MEINVIRKMEYKGYIIHVMQFATTFQYLFADKKGNIYQDRIDFKPSLQNKLKKFFHISKSLYTQEEIEAGEQMVLSGAVQSIDAMVAKIPEKKQKLPEFIDGKNTKCTWQVAITEDNEMAFECLNHGVIVPRIKDQKPFHEIEIKKDGVLSPIQFAQK